MTEQKPRLSAMTYPQEIREMGNQVRDLSRNIEVNNQGFKEERIEEILAIFEDGLKRAGMIDSLGKKNQGDYKLDLVKDRDFLKDVDSCERYELIVKNKSIKLRAACQKGILQGLRSLSDLLIVNGGIFDLHIVDYPDMHERRMLLDMGRKYFSKDWIESLIIEMARLKFNTIVFHFAENKGFRIESEFDPEMVSEDHLTKDEVKDLLETARYHGIEVIPDLDTPGHVEHILKTHPEFGQVDIHGNHNKYALDITNDKAVSYIKNLYKEHMELFKDCKQFHIGGDEYMDFYSDKFGEIYQPVLDEFAKEKYGQDHCWKDAVAAYLNDIADLVKSHGFKPRVWNDSLYYGDNKQGEQKQKIRASNTLGVDYWSHIGWDPRVVNLETFLEYGHEEIYNINSTFFYYVLRNEMPTDGRKQNSWDHFDQYKRIYEMWTPGQFSGSTIDDDDYRIKGASLAIWCDQPHIVGQDVIIKDVRQELRTFAAKTWNYKVNQKLALKDFMDDARKIDKVFDLEY